MNGMHTPGIREVVRVVPHLVENVAAVPRVEGVAANAFGVISFPLGSLCLPMSVVLEFLGRGTEPTRNEPLWRRLMVCG